MEFVRKLEASIRKAAGSKKKKRKSQKEIDDEDEVCGIAPLVGNKEKRVCFDRMVSPEQRAASDKIVAEGLTQEEVDNGIIIVFFAGGRAAMKVKDRAVHFYQGCQYLRVFEAEKSRHRIDAKDVSSGG
jgi:hypothetical protein